MTDAAAFYAQTLDNPIRRHDADGFTPVAEIAPHVASDAARHEARTSVLVEAQGLVHGSRNDDYGHPYDEYTRTAGMVNSLLADKLKKPLEPEDLAMMMCCLKMSRQVNRQKRDCMVDLAGYAEVIQWMIDERRSRSGS
jgi:hypothetical protein